MFFYCFLLHPSNSMDSWEKSSLIKMCLPFNFLAFFKIIVLSLWIRNRHTIVVFSGFLLSSSFSLFSVIICYIVSRNSIVWWVIDLLAPIHSRFYLLSHLSHQYWSYSFCDWSSKPTIFLSLSSSNLQTCQGVLYNPITHSLATGMFLVSSLL